MKKSNHCVFCSSLRVLSHIGTFPGLKDIPAGPITGKGNLRGNLIDCGGDQVNSALKKGKCREIDDLGRGASAKCFGSVLESST